MTIDAIGSSPSDEEVMIVNLKATVGQTIAAGDCVACLDCEKALFDVASAVSGTVIEVYVKPGDTVRVGMPMIAVRTDGPEPRAARVVREASGMPRLKRK